MFKQAFVEDFDCVKMDLLQDGAVFFQLLICWLILWQLLVHVVCMTPMLLCHRPHNFISVCRHKIRRNPFFVSCHYLEAA